MLNMSRAGNSLEVKSTRGQFIDAIIDSSIVAGISALSTGFLVNTTVAPGVAVASFLMAFLVKLRELRLIPE